MYPCTVHSKEEFARILTAGVHIDYKSV